MNQPTQRITYAAFDVRYKLAWLARRLGTNFDKLFILVGILFGSIGAAYLAAGFLVFFTDNGLVKFGVGAGVFLLILYAVLRATLKQESYESQLAQFAADNHFTFTDLGGIDDFHGAFAQLGTGHEFKNKLSGLYMGQSFEYGTYSYLTKRGNVGKYQWQGGLLRIALTRKVPHMVLDSDKNNLIGLTNLPWMQKMQTLQLEGDFSKYFRLYVPKGYQADALYVLTPELMQLLIDYGSQFDVEMVDNYLCFYSKNLPGSRPEQKLRECFSLIQTIGAEVQENTARYRDPNVGNRTANQIAKAGRLLKRSRWPKVFKLILYAIIAIPLIFVIILIIAVYLDS